MKKRNTDHYQMNKDHWDELAPVHRESYGVEDIINGADTLDSIQNRELGPLKGLKVLHLQCHIGTDSISLARRGADVTGVDISQESIKVAGEITQACGLKIDYLVSNIYDLGEKLKGKYDLVYTTQGVLPWLGDLTKWAELIKSFLNTEGRLYLMETHPLANIFQADINSGFTPEMNYFSNGTPSIWPAGDPDYSHPTYKVRSPSCEWQWTLDDIFNSVIASGMRIGFFHEYPFTFYKLFDGMEKRGEYYYIKGQSDGVMPLMFTLGCSHS